MQDTARKLASYAFGLAAGCFLFSACQTAESRALGGLAGEWGQANGLMGEFDRVTLLPDGRFIWIHEDDPLQARDTYRGRWNLREGTVLLIFEDGQTQEGLPTPGLQDELRLSHQKEEGREFLVSQEGFRLDRADTE